MDWSEKDNRYKSDFYVWIESLDSGWLNSPNKERG